MHHAATFRAIVSNAITQPRPHGKRDARVELGGEPTIQVGDLSAKRDFDSGEKEFQVNFAITYFFR